jgi:hypothetical protein
LRGIWVGFVCGALIWPTTHAFAAQNVVGQAVQRLHLSPQQLLSLRDFLGPFSRGIDVDASTDGLFVLRDAGTMAYIGEFSLRVSGDGRLCVDRIGGPARLDTSRAVTLPLRLTDKARVQVLATLANSEAAKPDGLVAPQKVAPVEPAPALPAVYLNDAETPGSLTQSRAEFWPDGSGWSASVRFQTGAPGMRLTERFFSPVRANAIQVWRDSVVEIDGDVNFSLADFENRYACSAGSVCVSRSISAENGLHVIRWRKTLISAVPPTLTARIAAPAIAPAATQAPAEALSQQDEAEDGPVAASPAPSADSTPGSPNGR